MEASLHGGASFTAIGDEFDRLEQSGNVINADVLDAWFPPSPRIVDALCERLDWLLRTSPPTGGQGLVRVIARTRCIDPESVLVGGGSSNLIFLAMREWLRAGSRVLVLDPSYGEYTHLLERVIGCNVERLPLEREKGYALDPELLRARLAQEYDLVALVNPNSPTGRHVRREVLESVLASAPRSTRFWIDETYGEYAGPGQSLEWFAAASANVVVCKSMSKVYALSGVRVAYLSANAKTIRDLQVVTPPWAVSLLGQVAAVYALQDPDYYAARYHETHRLRQELAAALAGMGLEVVPSTANFLLCHLPDTAPLAAEVASRCRERGLYIRDAGTISPALEDRAIRLAVKDPGTNRRMLQILREALD
jgi:histidinol-phosphate/aromatic aminotransferase/cobyric acid decarboxylase-like protein